jgi:ATP-dependent helicase/nuclease subunit B
MRPRECRVVQLAQQLLDFRGIAESLGGSSKAALEVAGHWVDVFEGWEWLGATAAENLLPGIVRDDMATLQVLHQANRIPSDPPEWVRRIHAHHSEWVRDQRSRQAVGFEDAVWFCSGKTPSPMDIAKAKAIWGIHDSSIRIWVFEPELLPTSGRTQRPIAVQSSSSESFELIPPRHLVESRSLEETALACTQQLLAWRSEGLTAIGLVALDRRALRRVRALLERAGESLSDGHGWALDTTVVATAVMGLNDLLLGRATTQSFLEWMHCPFVKEALQNHCEFGPAERERADRAIRAFGRVVSIDLHALVDQQLLPRQWVPKEATQFGKGTSGSSRKTLNEWLSQLLRAIENLGLEEVLALDRAGQSILAMLQEFSAKAQADSSLISATLWQSMLARELSRARYAETLSESAIRVMSLASILWCPPQAVMILGADHDQLPERPTTQFFEPAHLAEMGLQNPPERLEAEAFAQFASVWSQPVPMTLMAQSETPENSAEFSNWVRLLSMHSNPPVVHSHASAHLASPLLHLSSEPQARGDPAPSWCQPLPSKLSVSAAQALFNCEYQFFARSLLALGGPDDLLDDSPPTDLGSLIHLVLSEVTASLSTESEWVEWLNRAIDARLGGPFFAGHSREALRADLPEASRQKLKTEARAIVPSLARWLSQRPAMLGLKTEEPVRRQILTTPPCELTGRIDRWEIHAKDLDDAKGLGQTHRLIDFKTSDPSALKARVKPGDRDIQLALYAWLIGPNHVAEDAAYVSLRHDGVHELSLAAVTGQPLSDLVGATLNRLETQLQSIADGRPISRTGLLNDPKVCEFCSYRGVCRRDDEPAPATQQPIFEVEVTTSQVKAS